MYFAQLDENNKVLQVIVADQAFINSMPGVWVQTDYNGVSPKNYAGIGYEWDSGRNAFIPPKPYASWVLDEEACRYKAPIAYPDDGARYYWDEPSISWKLL